MGGRTRLVLLIVLVAMRSSFAEVRADTIRYVTADSHRIAATVWSPDTVHGVVILLHMLGKSGANWSDLAQRLSQSSFAAFAPDFRGHGESCQTTTGLVVKYSEFKATDYASFVRDVKATVLAVRGRFPTETIGIIGAGLGANVALNYAVSDSGVSGAILLSAGTDYRGITLPANPLPDHLAVTMVAASDDDYAAVTAREFSTHNESVKQIEFEKGGHGTYMLESHPELIDSILTFLQMTLH